MPLFPLTLVLCSRCGLAQLNGDGPDEVEDPAAPPPTSSATIAMHARAMVGELVAQGLASRERRVLELASHRGYLRPFFAESGIETTVLAVDATEEAGCPPMAPLLSRWRASAEAPWLMQERTTMRRRTATT